MSKITLRKDSCQGIAFRHSNKLEDSITRVAQLFDTAYSQGLKPFPIDFVSARLKLCPDTSLISTCTPTTR
jgi:hypothetical protein